MRRADRLFQITQHLRARRLTTAAQLAQWLQCSARTIYRDVQDLTLSGVPVEGEAGAGYRIRHSYDLTPVMFTREEIEAIVAGARMVETFGDPALAGAARSALSKVALVLPKERREELNAPRVFVPKYEEIAGSGSPLETIRNAATGRLKLRAIYSDGAQETARTLRPLGVFFWGRVWTVAAWCELRNDFRSFRLDRFRDIEVLPDRFAAEPGKTLDDFYVKVGVSRKQKDSWTI